MRMKSVFRRLGILLGLTSLTAMAGQVLGASDLMTPFRVEADGQPIDTDVGHAVPLVVDFDSDGIPDLLVGQFGEGKLKIFRNEGTKTQPKFRKFAWFQADGSVGKVPAG